MIRVMYASTKNEDMYYRVREHVHDPFFYIETDTERLVFVDSREFALFADRADVTAEKLEPFLEKSKNENGNTRVKRLALYLFKEYGLIKGIVNVSSDFPLDLADFLREQGVELVVQSPLYKERSVKTPDDIEQIRSSIKRTEKAFLYIEEVLAESVITGEDLQYQGQVLTSELLKALIEHMFIDDGLASYDGMIIASGEHGVTPHHQGSGPIRPHETLVCDIFPRDRTTGYVADLTRTYVKGEPKPEVVRMHAAVLDAQTKAIAQIAPGVRGSAIHQTVVDTIADHGFDPKVGFLHGTGHGIGLAVHEAPTLSAGSKDILESGNIVTVEPGLYFPGIGAIRIEDDVLITESGAEQLSQHSRDLVIE